jgi:toxin ParE1/3/4
VEMEIRRLAEAELAEAAAWYELRRQGLGDEFLEAFRTQMKTVCEAPTRWPIYVRNIRKYSLQRFPFIAYYDIRGDRVRILRVVHAKRNPEPIHALFE